MGETSRGEVAQLVRAHDS